MAEFLVTGGAGFIGALLVERLLSEGVTVRVIDDLATGSLENLPPEVAFAEGDINEPKLLRQLVDGADGIFHLAAKASRISEKRLAVVHEPARAGDPRNSLICQQLAARMLSFTASTPPDKSLSRTFDWYSKSGEQERITMVGSDVADLGRVSC